jgi:peptidoglycan/xylan/chitin deacetylase (PgdA/CDA1 family)
MNHLNGWETDDAIYIKNIVEAARYIDSNLYRPPYGRITAFQARQLKEVLGYQLVMWTILSGDFDTGITADQCWKNVRKKTREGSIIVFHDSEKALPRMKSTLENTLEHFSKEGYQFGKLT